MTDNPEFYDADDWLIDDPNSPFYGLPRGDIDTVPDAHDTVLGEVLDRLGIVDFSDLFVDIKDAEPEELRGNRFTNLVDAIVYLAEAGILQFGDVVLDEDLEIGVSIGDSP